MIAALAILLLSCSPSDATRTYQVRGVVREVRPEWHQVIVAHEDIPDLMPAMTMNFDVDDARLLERLEPGQRIEFELAFDGRSYRILSAEILAGGSGRAVGAGFAATPGEADAAPDFSLLDQEGRPLALSELRGKAVLLDFVYTRCPGPCPILTGRHVEVQRALSPAERSNSWFVSISLDPAHDTPAELQRYASARGADLADWSFLTGDPDEVAAVIERYGVGSTRQPDGSIEHLVATFLIDADGNIARRYLGLDHEPEELARDLRRLATAAAAGGAGSPAEEEDASG